MGLESDYKYCKNIIKKNSKSFYRAFSSLSKDKSNDIYAIYAFCRAVDDISDIEKSKEKLEIFEMKWISFKNGDVPDEPIWRALAHTFSKYEMNYKAFDDMIKGQYSDFEFTQPKTQKNLDEYCYYVAGTVGLMILPILSKKHEELKEVAITLGRAMQITNILRDIGEDYNIGRIYIPVQIMNNYSVSNKHFENHLIDENFIALWEELAQLSEKNYEISLKSINLFDKDSRLPVLISAMLYKEILNEIRRNEYDCLSKRNYVKKHKKIIILITARLTQN